MMILMLLVLLQQVYTKTIDTTTLSDGMHTINVKLTNTDGQTSTNSITINVDNRPLITITKPTTSISAKTSIDAVAMAIGGTIVSLQVFADAKPLSGTIKNLGTKVAQIHVNNWNPTKGAHILEIRTIDSANRLRTVVMTVTRKS